MTGATQARAALPNPDGYWRAGMSVLAVVLVCALWEAYKAVGSEDGGSIFGVRVLPRADVLVLRSGHPVAYGRGTEHLLWTPSAEGDDRLIAWSADFVQRLRARKFEW